MKLCSMIHNLVLTYLKAIFLVAAKAHRYSVKQVIWKLLKIYIDKHLCWKNNGFCGTFQRKEKLHKLPGMSHNLACLFHFPWM